MNTLFKILVVSLESAVANPLTPVNSLPSPTNDVAVITPVTLTLLAPLTVTPPVNVAAVPVMILSVDATPVNPVPSPLKLVAVSVPLTFASPPTSRVTVGLALEIPTLWLVPSIVNVL